MGFMGDVIQMNEINQIIKIIALKQIYWEGQNVLIFSIGNGAAT